MAKVKKRVIRKPLIHKPLRNLGRKVILTADGALMSTSGGGIFLGFAATLPASSFLPLKLFLESVFRPAPSNETGESLYAPLGLRVIEGALIESGVVSEEDVTCVHPKNIQKFIGDNTKIVGISVMDPKGMGPASSTFSGPFGMTHKEAYTHSKFKELMSSPALKRAKQVGAKIIVGGYGSWQLSENDMEIHGIDHVIVGEGDRVVVELVKSILEDNVPNLPSRIVVSPDKLVPAYQIPRIYRATCGGIIEISRGCGRSCKFCSPNMRRLRHRNMQDIIHDVNVNVQSGQRSVCLHAEDVLQYGGTPVKLNPDKVLELFENVLSTGVEDCGISHATFSTILWQPNLVERLREILGLSESRWLGFQTGIETGSPRLIASLMHMKPYPFKPEDWQKVVVEGAYVATENYLVPAATIIVNLPGETEDDVVDTIELIVKLKPIRSLIVPLLFVPYEEKYGRMRFIEDARWYHFELYRVIWEHNMFWFRALADDYLSGIGGITRIGSRIFSKAVTGWVDNRIKRIICNELQERIKRGLFGRRLDEQIGERG